MGKAIELAAREKGHSIVKIIRSLNSQEISLFQKDDIDVAIEFTTPEAARNNIEACLRCGIPVVSGTTGWNESLSAVGDTALQSGTAFLHASNFSIGMNIFFEINKRLAEIMNHQPSYQVSIEETHHTAKKDLPSGTAITIAEEIIEQVSSRTHWAISGPADNEPGRIPITAYREADVPGIHTVKYQSAIDGISLKHTAYNRSGFAYGAVLAAAFIAGRKGIFTMRDVLQF